MDDPGLPAVVSEFALANSFLGRIVEVCIVTEDYQRTMAGLVRLGIGPFRVYTFDDSNLADPTYQGQDSPFSRVFREERRLDVGDHATADGAYRHA